MNRHCFILLLSLLPITIIGQVFYSQEDSLHIINNYGNFTDEGGSGVSFADFNLDGRDDLTFSTEEGKNILFYENKGSHFELLDPIIINTSEGRQILWVDFDNDNDKDLIYATYGNGVFLYENDGSLNFTDITSDIGLNVSHDFGSGVSFGDINNDGNLDLYLANYNQENQLFLSTPTGFSDITLSSFTANGIAPSFCSSLFDFNNDGLLDIYVINDKITHSNALYMNIGNNTFIDISVPSGSDIAIDAMNGGIGDYNQDGYFDIYITDEHDSVFLENQGDNTFLDIADSSNTLFERLGWGGNFIDFDNDQDLDLYVSHGNSDEDLPSAFYENNENIYTEPYFNLGGISNSDTLGSYTNVIGDINNDGLQDIVTGGVGQIPFRSFINHSFTDNNFIKLDLIGTNSNRNAYGAIIEIKQDITTQWVTKMSANAYLAQNSDHINIGLGTSGIDTLIIHWPFPNSKDTISSNDLDINKLNIIEEGNPIISIQELSITLENHTIHLNPIPSQIYIGTNNISSNTKIKEGAEVSFISNGEISLEQGFEIKVGASFIAEIEEIPD